MTAFLPISPVCDKCANLLRKQYYHGCIAFPRNFGIPLDIWFGENDHTNPFPGDGGVLFSPKKEPENPAKP